MADVRPFPPAFLPPHYLRLILAENPMDVRDAVASRFSCRAFLPTPLPLGTVRDILDRAARAPVNQWRAPRESIDGFAVFAGSPRP